jgi:hypothetical protein
VIRKRQPVDDYITAVMIARLSRPDAAGIFAKQESSSNADLLREAEQLRQRLDGLAEAYADGTITPSQLRKGTERLRTALVEVENKITPGDGMAKVGRAVASAEDVAAAWHALDTETQRALINALMVIRIDPPGRGVWKFRPESVRIGWKQS